MSDWLTGWGKPVPAADHHDHSMEAMPGMMIEHHKGAVTMAKTEQSSGKDTAAIALAKKIETDQNREIATLQRLLSQLPGN